MFVQISCFIAFLQLTACFPTIEFPTLYDGHKVLEILHKAEDDYLKILSLEAKYELDFWKMPKHTNDTMTIRVGPNHLEDFLHELEAIDADVTTMIEDVQQMVDEQKHSYNHRRATSRSATGVLDLHTFNRFDTIQEYLAAVVSASLPNGVIAEVENLGVSYEGRNVDMIKFSKGGSTTKRKIFIDGGIHAREWVAPATVIYMIEQLAFNSSVPNTNAIMDIYDIYLVPVVNPDGYEFSHTTTRLWRKNRRVTSGTSCRGVDLNRNFPFQWDPSIGGSTSPCSDLYSGSVPGSEAETQNIVQYLTQNGHMFDAYLTIHSYGQMWLYPWGYTSAYPSDAFDLELAARSATYVARKYYGTDYIVGPTTTTLYSAAGGSDDFAKGGADVKYSYTIELRDTGRYGFVLPENLIISTASEFFEGFLAFCSTMHNQIINSGK